MFSYAQPQSRSISNITFFLSVHDVQVWSFFEAAVSRNMRNMEIQKLRVGAKHWQTLNTDPLLPLHFLPKNLFDEIKVHFLLTKISSMLSLPSNKRHVNIWLIHITQKFKFKATVHSTQYTLIRKFSMRPTQMITMQRMQIQSTHLYFK